VKLNYLLILLKRKTMATKRVNVGKVIGQVGGLRVRQTESVGKVGNKMATKSTSIGIYTGKKMVETGFKTKESAIIRAKEISQIVK
jgi:hypothetical protein